MHFPVGKKFYYASIGHHSKYAFGGIWKLHEYSNIHFIFVKFNP